MKRTVGQLMRLMPRSETADEDLASRRKAAPRRQWMPKRK
jgi:hypothetical protein